jgi:hypothetical protein
MITDITKKEQKLRTRSQLGIKPESVKFGNDTLSVSDNMEKLDSYNQYWQSLSDFRVRFRKNVDYLRGRQLDNYVTNDAGDTVKESEYISDQGKTPFVQNIIAPVLKSIEGLFRQDMGQSIVVSRKPNSAQIEKMMTNALQSVLSTNETKEIDPRTLDYFLLSGLPCQRLGFDFIDHLKRYDVVINYIDPNYIFFNNDIQDIRGTDLRIIGQLHDLIMDDLLVNFAQSSKDKEYLKSLYLDDKYRTPNYDNLTKSRVRMLDFYMPNETYKCRVIEIWEKKAVEVIEIHDELDASEDIWDDTLDNLNIKANARYEQYRQAGITEEEIPRIHYKYTIVFKWFYKFMTPWGHILRQGESPYKGGIHPFVLAPYPLISGEVYGLVETLIDIQDQFNRMFTHMDFIMGTSAKNTLVIDEASLNGQNPEDIASDYRRVGGVLVLKLKDGAKPPFELRGAGLDRAVFELVNMYTKLMQDISGVQPALQGQAAGSGVPASRFIAETQNSIINLRPILDFYSSFRRKRDMKALQMILQFYKSKRYLAISGTGTNEEKIYDPALVKDAINDLDLVIAKGTDSPVFKAVNDEMLKEFTMAQLMPFEMFLKHTDYPFSKPLLEDIQNTKEQMQQGQQAGNGMVQQAQA